MVGALFSTRAAFLCALLSSLAFYARGHAQPAFLFPTENRALLEPGNEEKFFVGTVGKPWTSGCFGCVRSDGWQMHEGLDIRCVRRDKQGEPLDEVKATADGVVVYINTKSGLSNYGKYIVLRHRVDRVEIYSLYAHLSQVASGLQTGQTVRAGQTIAIMGRTSNTQQGISKDRAHVHFELNLLINDRFAEWYRGAFPGQRNEHGNWNGQNMLGLDPQVLLLSAHHHGKSFNLLNVLRQQTELCRVVVRDTSFPWLQRYALLIRPNPTAEKEGIAAYELALNYNGVPFEVIPRAASELKTRTKYHLLSVNEAEYRKNPCRKLVAKRGSRWELTNRGVQLLDVITH